MATLLGEGILEKLHEKISGMNVGEKLPSERHMAEEFGVSRNMLRESLRVLADQGVIEILPGKGNYVSNKQEASLSDQLEVLLFDSNSNLMEIVEVRQVLETETCLKAVQVATADDIHFIEHFYHRINEYRTQVSKFNEYDMQFHLQIAAASHNSIYLPLLKALYNISDRKIFWITELYPTRVDSAQKEHRELIEAIRNHDRKRAKAVASKHFNIQDILMSQSKLRDELSQKEQML
ncbi:MAG: FadR family transcriptional regulator [Clostridiales bacterium]|nr:FadR family transcriptional regulator [Clostridiales bacterium]